MNDFFESIKIRKVVIIYILVALVLIAISELPIFSKITVLDFDFWCMLINLVLFIYFVLKMFKNNLEFKNIIEDFKNKFIWNETLKILIMNITFSLSLVCLSVFLAYMINPEFCNRLLSEVNKDNSTTVYSVIFNAITVSFLAPFVEEFIFRGVILNRLKKRWGMTASIIVSSIAFGLIHMELAFFGAFVFGVMMCLLYIKTENLFFTISIHFMNNFIVSLISVISFFTSSTSSDANAALSFTKIELTLLGSISSIAFIVSSFFIFRYMIKNWPDSNYGIFK